MSQPSSKPVVKKGFKPPPELVSQLAKLLRGENRRNLVPQEALAIGDTVLNRTQLAGFPSDPMQVILQPKQYSPFNPEDPNFPVIQTFGPQDPAWQQYTQHAENILNPERQRSGYTHYFSGQPPAWASNLEGLTQIGSHWFGTEKRRPKAKPKAAAPKKEGKK